MKCDSNSNRLKSRDYRAWNYPCFPTVQNSCLRRQSPLEAYCPLLLIVLLSLTTRSLLYRIYSRHNEGRQGTAMMDLKQVRWWLIDEGHAVLNKRPVVVKLTLIYTIQLRRCTHAHTSLHQHSNFIMSEVLLTPVPEPVSPVDPNIRMPHRAQSQSTEFFNSLYVEGVRGYTKPLQVRKKAMATHSGGELTPAV